MLVMRNLFDSFNGNVPLAQTSNGHMKRAFEERSRLALWEVKAWKLVCNTFAPGYQDLAFVNSILLRVPDDEWMSIYVAYCMLQEHGQRNIIIEPDLLMAIWRRLVTMRLPIAVVQMSGSLLMGNNKGDTLLFMKFLVIIILASTSTL